MWEDYSTHFTTETELQRQVLTPTFKVEYQNRHVRIAVTAKTILRQVKNMYQFNLTRLSTLVLKFFRF